MKFKYNLPRQVPSEKPIERIGKRERENMRSTHKKEVSKKKKSDVKHTDLVSGEQYF